MSWRSRRRSEGNADRQSRIVVVRRLPPLGALDFGRHASVFGAAHVSRGQPSPSGRGQGEGSDVTVTLAGIGVAATNPEFRLPPSNPRTNPVELGGRGAFASAPIAAREELRSTPHPALSRRERVLHAVGVVLQRPISGTPRSGAIYVVHGVSLGNPDRITSSRGAAASQAVSRRADVAAPRRFSWPPFSQRSRVGLNRLRRSAALARSYWAASSMARAKR